MKLIFIFLAVPISATVLNLPAQTGGSYDLSWSIINGGGGTSSGGAYSVNGTIGQPEAGRRAGGSYTLIGGFWGVVAAGSPEPVPSLAVSRSGSNVVVTWPFPSTGFVLQQTTALVLPPSATPWTEVTFPAAIHVGPDWTVPIPPPNGTRFFRLRKP